MKNIFSLDIVAPPERVFACINEGANLMRWIPNLVENEVVVATQAVLGSKFRQVYVENGRRMEMHGEVIGFERNRYLACDIRGQAFDLAVEYRLEDLGRSTRLTQTSEVLFKSLPMRIIGTILSPFLKKASRQQAEAGFDKLRQLAESAPA